LPSYSSLDTNFHRNKNLLALYNADVYTLDPRHPKASALLIDNGKILAVGENYSILSRVSQDTFRYDAAGRVVLPGLTDAHIHLEQYALAMQKVDCETDSIEVCLRRVSERDRQLPPREWLLGHGWNQNNWAGGFGKATDIDAIVSTRPVYLTAKSLHAGWANTTALRTANITSSTPDPPGGRIGRLPDGQPDGILYESAMELIGRALPEPSTKQVALAIKAAQSMLWQMGVTSVHDFDRARCLSALQMLHQSGELGLRVIKSIPLESMPEAIQLGIRSGFGDDYLRIGNVKLFADGALGPQTAAMIQPYEGESENRGMLFLDWEDIAEHGRMAVEHGLALAVHAIGDRANHEILNGFEQIRLFEKEKGISPLRHRIEHVQLLHPDDTARLSQLGIIASMQPIHATSDMLMADRHWGERSRLSYAWRTLIDQETPLVFGSDAPVESPNPFWGLHAAITRRRQDGTPGPEGWYPEQKLSLSEALHAYTTGAAYAAGLEKRLGKLADGYFADLILLDSDPFMSEPDQIREMHPIATMISGQWVYQI
jgi:predicted amidohydrolase YtcJ